MTPAEHVAGFVAEGDAGPPQDDRLDRGMRGAAFPDRTAPGWNVPFRSNTISSDTFRKADIGQRMSVRTVGAKGASPWSQEAAAMVL